MKKKRCIPSSGSCGILLEIRLFGSIFVLTNNLPSAIAFKLCFAFIYSWHWKLYPGLVVYCNSRRVDLPKSRGRHWRHLRMLISKMFDGLITRNYVIVQGGARFILSSISSKVVIRS
jgi:hypothetical protein